MSLRIRATLRVGAALMVATLLAGSAVADGPEVHGGDSAVLRGGPGRTGRFPNARLPEAPVVLWKVVSDRPIHDPVVAENAVVVGDDDGVVASYDAKAGHLRWRNDDKRGQVFAASTIAGPGVFVSTPNGAEALAAADGTPLWKFPIQGGCNESSPLFVDRKVIVGGKNGRIYALSPATGAEVWSRDVVKDAHAPPPGFAENGRSSTEAARPVSASSDGSLVFQAIFDQCRVVALDVKTGKIGWSFAAKGWIYMAPSVDAGRVVFGSQANEVHALDAATGKVLWAYKTKARVEQGSAVSDDSVFVGACDGRFVALDLADGRERWSFDTAAGEPAGKNYLYSSPLLIGGAVVFGSGNGHVYALDAATGRLVWKVRPVEGSDLVSTPTTDGFRLFVTTRKTGNGGEHALVALGDAP